MPAKRESLMIDSVEVAEQMGVVPGTIKRWSRNGEMPKGRRVGPRLLKWNRAEIEQWIADGCPRPAEQANLEKALR